MSEAQQQAMELARRLAQEAADRDRQRLAQERAAREAAERARPAPRPPDQPDREAGRDVVLKPSDQPDYRVGYTAPAPPVDIRPPQPPDALRTLQVDRALTGINIAQQSDIIQRANTDFAKYRADVAAANTTLGGYISEADYAIGHSGNYEWGGWRGTIGDKAYSGFAGYKQYAKDLKDQRDKLNSDYEANSAAFESGLGKANVNLGKLKGQSISLSIKTSGAEYVLHPYTGVDDKLARLALKELLDDKTISAVGKVVKRGDTGAQSTAATGFVLTNPDAKLTDKQIELLHTAGFTITQTPITAPPPTAGRPIPGPASASKGLVDLTSIINAIDEMGGTLDAESMKALKADDKARGAALWTAGQVARVIAGAVTFPVHVGELAGYLATDPRRVVSVIVADAKQNPLTAAINLALLGYSAAQISKALNAKMGITNKAFLAKLTDEAFDIITNEDRLRYYPGETQAPGFETLDFEGYVPAKTAYLPTRTLEGDVTLELDMKKWTELALRGQEGDTLVLQYNAQGVPYLVKGKTIFTGDWAPELYTAGKKGTTLALRFDANGKPFLDFGEMSNSQVNSLAAMREYNQLLDLVKSGSGEVPAQVQLVAIQTRGEGSAPSTLRVAGISIATDQGTIVIPFSEIQALYRGTGVASLDDETFTQIAPILVNIATPRYTSETIGKLDAKTLNIVIPDLKDKTLNDVLTSLDSATLRLLTPATLTEVLNRVDQQTLIELLPRLETAQITEVIDKLDPDVILTIGKYDAETPGRLLPNLKLPEGKQPPRPPQPPRPAQRFRVVLDGRVSTVEAETFVEALGRVYRGRGSRATITKLL